MNAIHALTVTTRSHLPMVAVLAESLIAQHPAAQVTVVVADAETSSGAAQTSYRTLTPLEIGISAEELHRRALLYDAQGLISSLRPTAMLHLLEDGIPAVLLLDADMLVLAPIHDLWTLAATHELLLSPHSVVPRSDGPGIEADYRYLQAGTFNGGLLGVGQAGRPFLNWMAARVLRDCVRDPARGLLYTQTWLNLVPALFPHYVLRDPGINVTAHRLGGRDLGGTTSKPTLDGTAVRLLHFTGFDPLEPSILTRHLQGADAELRTRPQLAAVCADYASRVTARGWSAPAEYGWSRLACGLEVDAPMRALYRGAVLAADYGVAPSPPDPFDRDDPDAFLRWLQEPPAELSRHLLATYTSRADLRQAFPDLGGADLGGFLGWAAGRRGTDTR